MESFLQKYGATYEEIWDDLRPAPTFDHQLRRLTVRETESAIGARSDAELRQRRDAGLIALLAVQKNHGAL